MAAVKYGNFRRGEKAYIMNSDYLPIYVGEGLGDIDYDDAIDLAVIHRNALGLPATRESISMIVPPPPRSRPSHTSRASKNNPYICVHCDYKTTRYGNMVKHLENSHGDSLTDPRDIHY